jgi:hypothetical protein
VRAYHLTFERFGNEAATDLMPLCRACYDELYSRFYYTGTYGSVRVAGFAFLKDKNKARRKFVLAGHDDQGNAVIRRKKFNDRIQWWLKMDTKRRVLTVIGGLAVLAALVPVGVLAFTIVVNVLVWVVAIAAALAMLAFVLAVVFGVSLFGFVGGAVASSGKSHGSSTTQTKPAPATPRVDWKITKDAAGNTLIQQDKVAAWAHGGDTYYEVMKDATGNTILKQKSW